MEKSIILQDLDSATTEIKIGPYKPEEVHVYFMEPNTKCSQCVTSKRVVFRRKLKLNCNIGHSLMVLLGRKRNTNIGGHCGEPCGGRTLLKYGVEF